MNKPVLTQEPPLLLLPSLAKRLGVNEALILQRLYELEALLRPVELTVERWQAQLPWLSTDSVRVALGRLRSNGLITIEPARIEPRRDAYRLVPDALRRLVDQDVAA